MANDLQAFESLSKEEIMKMTGQDDGAQMSSITLPKLMINRQSEDDDGNALRPGVYMVYDSELETMVYGLKDKPIYFRPFVNSYQYMTYDSDNNNYSCSSVIFKSWKDEPIDSNGGLRCGRIIGKDREQLTQAEIDAQRPTRCYRLVYGLLTLTGTTATGESVTIEDRPVLFRVSGTNFSPIGQTLKSLKGRNSLMFNHVLELKTKRRKNPSGSIIFYVATINIADKEIEFSKKDLEHMDMFNTLITEENIRVAALWKEANSHKKNDAKSEKVIDAIEASPEEVLAS